MNKLKRRQGSSLILNHGRSNFNGYISSTYVFYKGFDTRSLCRHLNELEQFAMTGARIEAEEFPHIGTYRTYMHSPP